MSVMVNGCAVPFYDGETILDVCRRAGAQVPTLCFDDAFAPEGGCRVCLVEADGRVVAACHHLIRDGISIETSTERIKDLRRGVLELTLSQHCEGQFRKSPNGNEFERLLNQCGVDGSSFGYHPAEVGPTVEHPYLAFHPEACVLCRRCIGACEEIQGQFVYGVLGRGAHTRLAIGVDDCFASSQCTVCGACVPRCPSGALLDTDREQSVAATKRQKTVCGYCGVGCRTEVASANGKILRIDGITDATVNRGHLCSKGRYAHGYHGATDRLSTPMVRQGSELKPVSWPEAFSWLSARIDSIKSMHGPDAFGFITSARTTNEGAYLLQKFARAVIGTNNVDCCARICHSSTAAGLKRVTGTGAASASFDDIEKARCIVVAGANPTESHPVIGARIKRAALHGVPLIVIDPRRIELTEYATVHLAVNPGGNVALLNALAKVLTSQNAVDMNYVQDRTKNYPAYLTFLNQTTLDACAALCGIQPAQISAAGELMAKAGTVLFVHGLGMSELSQGTESVMALCNLALLTGSIGRDGAGMLPLRGQCNVQGNADMGCAPDTVVGYQPVSNPKVRRRFAALWNVSLPEKPGLTMTDLFPAALRQSIRALWIQGTDVAQSQSDQALVLKALAGLDLLVVQDPFLCETAKYAHVVLPAATALENDGTFTNGERRIQRVRPVTAPTGDAKPDWQCISELMAYFGQAWAYDEPSDVMEEIAVACPELFGGVHYARLEGDGLQWPCPNSEHPGTTTLHREVFMGGAAEFACIRPLPPADQQSNQFPFRLITGRVLQHYNVGTMTRRTKHANLISSDYLEINPLDAGALQILHDQIVHLSSRWGHTQVPVRITSRVPVGTLFLSFHFPETHVNQLVGPYTDPASYCPDYKTIAVRLDPL